MSKIRCLIVDDEPIAQRILEKYISNTLELEVTGICSNALEANSFLKHNDIDLIFLDLEMPRLKGFDFLKLLSNPPMIIITTAHREFALEGFEHGVIDYLLKPISFERFLKATNKIPNVTTKEKRNGKIVYVKSERKVFKLNTNDIRIIESKNNYIYIKTTTKNHIVYKSLSSFKSELPENFVQIHKSYIINKDYISSFSKDSVKLKNDEYPIGQKYKNNIGNF